MRDASREKIFLPGILSQFSGKCAMNGETLVLDTNAAISILNDDKYSRLLDNDFPGNIRCTSVIVQIELLGFPGITEEIEGLIRSFLEDISVVTIEFDIVETAIKIRRSKLGIKLPDAVIAATAIVMDATLVTNDDDLLGLNFPGLRTAGMKNPLGTT
jgi:predicted nucleic acid-binding protein